MAIIIDGIQNLAGKNLPNVKIDKIELSLGLDPEPESNPHINSEREYTYSGNQLVQKKSFSLKQIQNKNFFVDLTLSILNVESLTQSLVLNQINYLDFVYVKVIQSLSQNLTNELLKSNFPVDISKIKNISDYTEKVFKLSEFYNNKSLILFNNDSKVFKHTKQIRFTTKNPQKQNLDIFAFSYLDLDELVNSFELNIPNNIEIKGNVSKESAILNGKITSESYALIDKNNNVFYGIPYKGTNGKFYATKPTTPAQEATLEPLKTITTTNKKVSDLRNLEQLIANNFINNPQIKSKIFENLSSRKKTYFSELYKSRQKNNDYSLFFAFDIYNFLKDNSISPQIYDNPSVFDFIKIKKLNVIRKRVKTIDSVTNLFSEYTPDKTIISTSETEFGNIKNKFSFIDSYNKTYTTTTEDINSGAFNSSLPSFVTFDSLRKIASITELKIPTAANYRIFTFSDFEIASLTTGEFQYEINIEIEDKSNELVQMDIDYLVQSKNKLISYLSDSQRTDFFSVFENRQNEKFVSYQNKKYSSLNLQSAINLNTINQNLTIQNSPWIETPTAIVSYENKYFGNIDVSKKLNFYYNLLTPTTTNPTSIQSVINDLDSLILNIRKTYSIEEKAEKNTLSYKSRNIKTKSITNLFKTSINADLKKVGIDYVNVEQQNTSSLIFNSFGLPKISKSLFDNRIQSEIDKYFVNANINLSSLSSSFSNDDISSLSDIKTYSSCYFSPALVKLDNEEILLNNTDNSNTSLSQYDKIVTNSISTNNPYDKSVNNELLTKTNIKLSTIQNYYYSPTNVQLSFINKPSLFVDAEGIFNNSGFNTPSVTFNINDLCKLSNTETKNEENLLNTTPLTNTLLSDYIRPDTINTIQRFNILSDQSFIPELKIKSPASSNQNVKSSQVVPNSVAIKQNFGFQQVRSSSNALNTPTPATINTNSQQIKQSKNAFNSLVNIPLQIKSLMFNSIVDTKFKLNSLVFDPFLHPETQNFMRLNFQNICQIEYLAGFENNELNNPIWRLLTKDEYDQLTGQIIIRTKQYTNKLFNIGTETGLNFDIYNEFCVIDKEQVSPNISLQQNQVNILPNTNINIGNNLVNSNNILNNLKISFQNKEQEYLIKQLIVLNAVDSKIQPSYTFSKIELDNVNR